MTNSFAFPWVLFLTTLIPSLGMLFFLAWRKRRAVLAQLGSLHGLVLVRRGPRLARGICLFLGLGFLLLGAAGPQWGVDTNPESLAGPTRDLVVVLDLSRSMLAEQPSRQELARRGLNDLCETLKKRGGFRVALVVFAAKPRLVFPLTNDYDHLAEAIAQQDAEFVPGDLRPDPERGDSSGTRIGAALRLAVEAHDKHMQGAQEIILISDGDDPVPDNEWRTGIPLALEHMIPIHTVGLGTPVAPSLIPLEGDEVMRDENDKAITTSLIEAPLQEIARQTRGIYIPAHTNALPLGRLFLDIVASRPVREAQNKEMGSLVLYIQRYEWFLAGALFLLLATLLIGDGGFRAPPRFAYRGFRLALLPFALLLVSAVPREILEDLIRQGNAAFAEEKYADAYNLYQKAEETSRDPGLIAFNKAACLYRLGQYQEAENHYRRCLEDQQIPEARQAKAWFSLGNCLVQKKPASMDNLAEAMRYYRRFLAHAEISEELRIDARHNLEQAKLRWLKLRAEAKNPPDTPEIPDNPPKKEKSIEDGKEKKKPKEFKEKNEKEEPGTNTQKVPNQAPFVLPDDSEVVQLPPEVTERILEEAVRRIRRDWRRPSVPSSSGVKDW